MPSPEPIAPIGPRVFSNAARPGSGRGPAIDLARVDVLLVEDEPAHIELIQRAFATHSKTWRIAQVSTLREAREHLATQTPRLIIADWLLTDGEGIELLQSPTGEASVPVVILTSQGNQREAVELMRAGALDYIVKSEATLADMPHTTERALRHRRVEQTLREIVEGTSQIGQAYFDSLVLRLGSALGARFALVSELLDSDVGRLRTLAFAANGGLRDNVEYTLEGTPDAITLMQPLGFQTANARAQFPGSSLLHDLGASRYLGLRLVSSTGQPIGVLSVIHDDPIDRALEPETLLRVFAARAAAEMERLRADRQLDLLRRRLTHEASHDALTGLANRKLLMERSGAALDRFRSSGILCAVLFCDLDNYKLVNKNLGYHVGENLLRAVAARISNTLRPSDLGARLGGDQFALLLEDLPSADHAYAIGQRIVEALREPHFVEGQTVHLRTSLGVAISSTNHDRVDRLLRDADLAMTRSKEGGGNRVEWFDEEMGVKISRRHAIEQALHQAVAEDRIEVAFQPQQDLLTGATRGFEALARWNDSVLGMVGPGEFIPIAEETGLIVPLGRQVLRKACRWLAARHREGASSLTVAVNLSGRQLQRPELVEEVAAALRESGLSATSLHLEITESIAMSNAAATAAQLRALKHIGVRIAVDDFGTGYSSLAYLRRFPVDVLKIDRAFISRLGRDAEDSDVVRFLIALARSLGLRTIAEGVELKEQLEVLRNLGCDEVQGFLTGRPMTGRDAEGWLTNNPHVQGSVTASIPRPRRDSDHGGRRALG